MRPDIFTRTPCCNACALALAPLAVEPAKEHGFVTAFLSVWGGAMDRRRRRRGQ